MNIEHSNVRFAWCDQNAKHDFITKQASDLLSALTTADVQFCSYCRDEVMYLNGQGIDMFCVADLLSALKGQMNIFDLRYSHDTNYMKLPVIVLAGDRSAGKNTLAEMVGNIFPKLLGPWDGDVKQFNAQFTNKLLLVDEHRNADKPSIRNTNPSTPHQIT